MSGSEPSVILVVDDEREVRRLLTGVLAQKRFRVLEAGSGEEALQVAECFAGGIDLLITDISMPGIDGLELARRLLARRPGMKVLYISGYCDVQALAGRADGKLADFLRKPFGIGKLLDKVTALLAASAAPRKPAAKQARQGPASRRTPWKAFRNAFEGERHLLGELASPGAEDFSG